VDAFGWEDRWDNFTGPPIVTRTLAISSVTSRKARMRETETDGQSSCVSLMVKQYPLGVST
jgi:hypothetical protein